MSDPPELSVTLACRNEGRLLGSSWNSRARDQGNLVPARDSDHALVVAKETRLAARGIVQTSWGDRRPSGFGTRRLESTST